MNISKRFMFVLVLATAIVLLLIILVTPRVVRMLPVDISALVHRLPVQTDALKGASNPVQNLAARSKTEATAAIYSYTQNLTVGSRGDDVVALQQVLIGGGYLKISEPTTYFGLLTKAALAAWQKDNSISPASGYFGPVTRTKVAESATVSTNATATSNISAVSSLADGDLSATFIKTYHLRDNTDGFSVFPINGGGYLLTGETVWDGGMAAPYPYAVKIDAKGNKQWTRDFSSSSNALGELSSSYIGRLAAETTDGNIITASDVVDFVDENVKEIYGDILVTKLNSKGVQQWSVMLGDYSIDRPQKMWAMPGGGVLLLARFMKTGYGNDVADTSVVPKYSVLIGIDKNGKVQSSKKMSWDALDMQRLADGSFIAMANIKVPTAEQPEHILGPELISHDLPTMIKLDGDLKITWAKSLEMIPSQINSVTSYASSTFTMGTTTIRLAGGDFRVVQPAPDGGFLAFGFNNLLLTQGLSGAVTISKEDTTLRPFMAVKVDAAGNYQWARKLTVNLASGGAFNDFHVIRTADNHFIIMKGVVRDSDSLEAKTNDTAQKRKAFLDKCEELKAQCQNEENLIPELQPYVKAQNDALAALADASAGNIGLIKTDADFNPRWVKKYDAERELAGYGIQPTPDKGVVVVGTMLTTKMHMVMGRWYPYEEAAVIKVDVNGGTSGCASVTDHSKATLEDQSSYLVMQNMSVAGAQDAKLNINKKVKEKVADAKNTARDICKYAKTSVAPVYSYINSSIQSGGVITPPTAKTWALINYEKAKESKIELAKNQQINDELLPILNQIFNNQVKMTDSTNSMWLTYYFPRLVTRADVEAIQKYYEGLGYKIDESEGGLLYVSKVGLTLHMTFYVNDKMRGKLEVLF